MEWGHQVTTGPPLVPGLRLLGRRGPDTVDVDGPQTRIAHAVGSVPVVEGRVVVVPMSVKGGV